MAKKSAKKKLRSNLRANKKRKLGLKSKSSSKKLKLQQQQIEEQKQIEEQQKLQQQQKEKEKYVLEDDSDSSLPITDRLSSILEPHPKPYLISLLADFAAVDRGLLRRLRSVSDKSIAHRKLFVHGLAWDCSNETLREGLEEFGEIEECNVIMDKCTGRNKGYGFVVFSRADAACKALKLGQKRVGNHLVSLQLAAGGPLLSGSSTNTSNSSAVVAVDSKRIHVSNVPRETTADKLRSFFEKFGEVEAGPMGFDVTTGKSRGFCVIVYRTSEGAKKCLEEPFKMFEGHRLHCQYANEKPSKVRSPVMPGNGKGPGMPVSPASSTPPAPVMPLAGMIGPPPPPEPMLAALAAQNLALLQQNPAAAYAVLLQQNQLLTAALNPMAAAAFNPAAAAAFHSPVAGPPPPNQSYRGSNHPPHGSFGAPGDRMHSLNGLPIGHMPNPAARPRGPFGGYPSHI